MSLSAITSSSLSLTFALATAAGSPPVAATGDRPCLAALSLEGVTAGDEERVLGDILSVLKDEGMEVGCRDRAALTTSSCVDGAACVAEVAERCRCAGLLELHGLRFGPTLSLTSKIHDPRGQQPDAVDEVADVSYAAITEDAELRRLARAVAARIRARSAESAQTRPPESMPSSRKAPALATPGPASQPSKANVIDTPTRARQEESSDLTGPVLMTVGGVAVALGVASLAYVGLILPGEMEANLLRLDQDGASALVTEDAELYQEQRQRGALLWYAGLTGVTLGLTGLGAGAAFVLLRRSLEPSAPAELPESP